MFAATLVSGLSDLRNGPEKYYYFTPADQTAADVYTSFVLPPGVTCERCVVQWRWVTGNSCYGESAPPSFCLDVGQFLEALHPCCVMQWRCVTDMSCYCEPSCASLLPFWMSDPLWQLGRPCYGKTVAA